MQYLKRIFIHLLLAGVFVFLTVWGSLAWMSSYTNHNRVCAVPDVGGLSLEEAENQLTENGLQPIISDSIWQSEFEPGTILEQHPLPGDVVKPERNIYLTIASVVPPQQTVPNLIDKSPLMARQMLAALEIPIQNEVAVPDTFPVIVGMSSNGKPLHPGDQIERGSPVTLYIGTGTN